MSDPLKNAGVPMGYLDTVCVAALTIVKEEPIPQALFGDSMHRANYFTPIKSLPRPGLIVGPRSLFPQNEPGKTRLELTIGILALFMVPERIIYDDTQPSAAGFMDVLAQIFSADENRLLQTPASDDEGIVPDGPTFDTFDISDPQTAGSEVEREFLLEIMWPAEVRLYQSIPAMILP